MLLLPLLWLLLLLPALALVLAVVLPSPPLVDPIRHVITDPIYPYPYRVVITTLVAEQLDAYPDL